MLGWFSRASEDLGARHIRHTQAAVFKRRLRGDRGGNVAIIVAVSATPVIIAVGAGMDISRMAGGKATLQNAADAAALAGATLYTSSSKTTNAQTSAQNYFDKYAQGRDLTVSSRTVTAAPSSSNSSLLTVSVDATATLQTTFGGLVGFSTMTVKAHSVAAIPTARPVVTPGPGAGSPSQVLSASGPKSYAYDWNSAYLYGVPKSSSGQYDYTQYPPLSQFYEVASNCSSAIDAMWTSKSACNGGFGAVAPVNLNYDIPPDQPIAFMFVNMNNGMFPPGGAGGYGQNQYGSQPGWYQLMTTATMSLGQSPSQITDNSVNIVRNLTGFNLSQGSTTYSKVNNSAKSNCAIQIQLVTDPSNLPTNPPYPGQCLAANDPASGYQYANLSCNQINGRTFMYWWNDMGANPDDFDYKNLYFTLTCRPGVTNPDGGTLGQNGNSPAKGSPATLIQ